MRISPPVVPRTTDGLIRGVTGGGLHVEPCHQVSGVFSTRSLRKSRCRRGWVMRGCEPKRPNGGVPFGTTTPSVGGGSDLVYFRVTDGLRGLISTAEFRVRWVTTDPRRFFSTMTLSCRPGAAPSWSDITANSVIGVVGRWCVDRKPASSAPGWPWRLLRWLQPSLRPRPGHYSRSGISISVGLVCPEPKTRQVEGDWLPGGATTMWRTAVAREVRFLTRKLEGYGNGEDLELLPANTCAGNACRSRTRPGCFTTTVREGALALRDGVT